jgi:hypothetical protein
MLIVDQITLSELLNGDLFTFSENKSVPRCCSDTWNTEHFSSLLADSETRTVCCVSEFFVQYNSGKKMFCAYFP